jgi:hypothetical protein
MRVNPPGMTTPDSIFAQCGVQFRLRRVVAIAESNFGLAEEPRSARHDSTSGASRAATRD